MKRNTSSSSSSKTAIIKKQPMPSKPGCVQKKEIAPTSYHRDYILEMLDHSYLFSIPLACVFLYLIVHYMQVYFVMINSMFRSFLDMNKRVYNHVPGECSFVGGLEKGAVDMAWLDNQTLVISTGTDLKNASNATSGALAVWRIGEGMAEEVKWSGKEPPTFNPYGIAVHGSTVMVVNSRRGRLDSDSVEVLTLKGGKVRRKRKPISSKLFTSLTAIVPLNEKDFLVSNTFTYRIQWLQWTEFAGHFRSGSILYFDGRQVVPVLTKLRQPMGMAKDGSLLYVSVFGDSAIHVYQMKSVNNFQKIEEIELRSAPHFLSKEPKQNALVATVHSLKLRFLAFETHPHEYLSPSRVIRVKKGTDNKWKLSQFYCNDGATIRGASSAVRLPDNRIVIGNVNKGLLKCQLTSV